MLFNRERCETWRLNVALICVSVKPLKKNKPACLPRVKKIKSSLQTDHRSHDTKAFVGCYDKVYVFKAKQNLVEWLLCTSHIDVYPNYLVLMLSVYVIITRYHGFKLLCLHGVQPDCSAQMSYAELFFSFF